MWKNGSARADNGRYVALGSNRTPISLWLENMLLLRWRGGSAHLCKVECGLLKVIIGVRRTACARLATSRMRRDEGFLPSVPVAQINPAARRRSAPINTPTDEEKAVLDRLLTRPVACLETSTQVNPIGIPGGCRDHPGGSDPCHGDQSAHAQPSGTALPKGNARLQSKGPWRPSGASRRTGTVQRWPWSPCCPVMGLG